MFVGKNKYYECKVASLITITTSNPVMWQKPLSTLLSKNTRSHDSFAYGIVLFSSDSNERSDRKPDVRVKSQVQLTAFYVRTPSERSVCLFLGRAHPCTYPGRNELLRPPRNEEEETAGKRKRERTNVEPSAERNRRKGGGEAQPAEWMPWPCASLPTVS